MVGSLNRVVEHLRRPRWIVRDMADDPAAALFQTVRLRLTLWYIGVLAVILLVSSIVLYVSVRHSLLAPVESSLQQNAQTIGHSWVTIGNGPSGLAAGWSPCGADHLVPADWFDVCYDVHGRVLGASHYVADFVPAVANPSLVSTALSDGQAQDIVQLGNPLGAVERYAVRVDAPDSGAPIGVVQVAATIPMQALDTLLHLLVLFGFLTLLLAGVGGLFLANRALQPARLAHARQRDFIADASHELRTPLTMLRSNVEVVLRGKNRLPPEDVALLEDTVMEAGHLAAIANSMLDLARLESDRAHLEEEIVDLGILAADVVRWASSLACEHGLDMRTESTGPVLVLGDRLLLQQALLILIDNAIKYNRPNGGIVVRTERDGPQARIEVEDTGIGIAADHVGRLGERFYRVDKARSRETGGAGLGLSIVRHIAARHRGSFQLRSDPGYGTTASLTLPAVHSPQPAAR